MEFDNVYEDSRRAEAYARLEFPGTYYLAFRDLPVIIAEHARGRRALDFGCGTGRSTRFLRKLGYEVSGIDISEDMLKLARAADPGGEYFLSNNQLDQALGGRRFDLILSTFTFDNIPTGELKVSLFAQLGNLLTPDGVIVSLVSSPDIYMHEWASFSTKDFPENRLAKSGDRVKIIMTDVEDRRPVEDVVWSDESYREVYQESGLALVETYRPLAQDSEPFAWVNETRIAPWVIYALKRR